MRKALRLAAMANSSREAMIPVGSRSGMCIRASGFSRSKLEAAKYRYLSLVPTAASSPSALTGRELSILDEVSTGKILDQQKVSALGCGSVAFSPDGRFLIAPSTGGLIKWPYDHAGTIRVFKVTPP